MFNPEEQARHINILVVDDEPLVRRSLSEFLTLEGYTVSSASNGKEGLQALKEYVADIIITDIKMPEMDGMQMLAEVRKHYPQTSVIVITGYGSIENAVEAMKQGAYDYITKPIIDNEIRLVLQRLIRQQQLIEENIKLKEQISAVQREKFLDIVGKDEKMQKIYTLIEAIACTRSTVLIHGESGTGKHLIAHAIHDFNEMERGKPFVEVSCGALTETLLESELFGHVKGAFTGAIKDKVGRFELADGGTIFLDEIDAFSPALQVKLLRVLQEGEFERVGESDTRKVDVRVVAASNQDLQKLIVEGKFRKDLYYRLNIINIDIPPLRDRKVDIPLLINDFLVKHAKRVSKKIDGISNKALSMLINYNWPGNIRELENVIERAIILSKGPMITPEDLPDFLNHKSAVEGEDEPYRLKEAMRSPEKDLIIRALDSVDWNRNEAAKVLGINRTTLYKKMLKYGLLKNKRLINQ
ncbi:MAG TPA: sigma-54 dependent transcriptional regulator [Candidatus Omnitrophota bacterium]|nr:sigma-54 dependent transcriptional regulator [Candidatus Omnitrophota bacterium]HRZ14824.1 sigma-54 dependent transcriptional regulator [Candidatus Omnitrophota bacterium]